MSQHPKWIEDQLRAGNAPADITAEVMLDFLREQGLRFAFSGGIESDEYAPETCFRAGTQEVPSRGMTLLYDVVRGWAIERAARVARQRWITATQGFASVTFPVSWERMVLLAVIDYIAETGPDAKIQAAIAVAYMDGARVGANPVTDAEIEQARELARFMRGESSLIKGVG